MSRFAQTYEDPEYEYIGEDDMERTVEHSELGKVVDGWIRSTVAKKPQPNLN